MSFECPHTGDDMPCPRCDNEMLVKDNSALRNEIERLKTLDRRCRGELSDQRRAAVVLPDSVIEFLEAEPQPETEETHKSLVRRILLSHGHTVSGCETCDFPIVDGLLKCLVCHPEPGEKMT